MKKKLLMGLTAAAVMTGCVAFGACAARADGPDAILSTLLAIQTQLELIERNTRPLAGATP